MKILCITGTRADYGIYRPLLSKMQTDSEIDLKLVVTGMHLLSEYGQTIRDIENDQHDVIATPNILFKGDSTLAMSQSFGMAVLYFSDLLQLHKPQFVLLLGDRGEMLAAAVAAHYQNIGIIHLHGGEMSGSADDAVRHCISKLAHLHFVSCEAAAKLLLQFGEEKWRIVPIGSLRKSEIMQLKRLPQQSKERLNETYGLTDQRKTIMFVMHPDSKEAASFHDQIDESLAALASFKQCRIIMIGSNSDAGGELFMRRMERFCNDSALVSIYSSIPSDHYLYLLSKADVLVGNSSSGIIEAPFFQLPFIHIGNRQKNRVQGDNVEHVSYNRKQIQAAIERQLSAPRNRFKNNPYDLNVIPENEMLKKLKLLSNKIDLLQKFTIVKV